MDVLKNLKENKIRVITQGVLLAGAMALADQSVVLPVIVKHFSNSNTLVGLFTSLLRGGAIVMQLYAAFHARNDARVMPKLKKVFASRFAAWFSIGIIILLLGNSYPGWTLFFFSISLFIFSFSAGFGTIYYQELMGKMFTPRYRGKLIAQRQILSGLVSIIGVIGVSGYLLETFPAPQSYAYIFLVSGIVMGIGYLFMLRFKEAVVEKPVSPHNTFGKFIKNAVRFLRIDKQLRRQIIVRLFSFGFMLLMPFIILHVKNNYPISGKEIAWFAGIQMVGAMLANVVWGKLSSKGNDRMIIFIAISLNILAYASLLLWQSYFLYFGVFFLLGASVDGYRLAFSNLLLSRAPHEHRPAYVAIYNNFVAIGLFFAIPGGFILDTFGFKTLTIISLLMLASGLVASFGLSRNCRPYENTY